MEEERKTKLAIRIFYECQWCSGGIHSCDKCGHNFMDGEEAYCDDDGHICKECFDKAVAHLDSVREDIGQ